MKTEGRGEHHQGPQAAGYLLVRVSLPAKSPLSTAGKEKGAEIPTNVFSYQGMAIMYLMHLKPTPHLSLLTSDC